MTPEEALERIERMRIELRKCMRTVSVPDVEWAETDALLALVDEMSDYTWYETEGDHRLVEGFADRIRAALGATGGGRRGHVERLAPAVDSRCAAGASRRRATGPRATGGRRP